MAAVISKNLARRHLTGSQWDAVAAEIANLKSGSQPGQSNFTKSKSPKLDTNTGTSLSDAAKKLNVSPRSVATARVVKQTPAQEAEAIFRRKAIYEELHPETRHGAVGNGRSAQSIVDNLSTLPSATPADRFTADAAAKTGKDERTIRRAAARGEALGDDLAAVAGTSLDKGVELDALAKMAPEGSIHREAKRRQVEGGLFSASFFEISDPVYGRRHQEHRADFRIFSIEAKGDELLALFANGASEGTDDLILRQQSKLCSD